MEILLNNKVLILPENNSITVVEILKHLEEILSLDLEELHLDREVVENSTLFLFQAINL